MSSLGSSSSGGGTLSLLPGLTGGTIKLSRDNYLLWKAQQVPILRGARAFGYVDGTAVMPSPTFKSTVEVDGKLVAKEAVNPDYDVWATKEQQVLGYLLLSLEPDILAQVVNLTTTTAMWRALEGMFASKSKARVNQIRAMLAQTRKHDLGAAEYYNKMKALADQMALTG